MPKSEKDGLPKEVLDRWVSFQMALSNKRKYPAAEFTAFATSARRYLQAVGRDPFIHREMVSAINGLVDFLSVNDGACRMRSSTKQVDWRVCSSLGTTHTSTATSHPVCSGTALRASRNSVEIDS